MDEFELPHHLSKLSVFDNVSGVSRIQGEKELFYRQCPLQLESRWRNSGGRGPVISYHFPFKNYPSRKQLLT